MHTRVAKLVRVCERAEAKAQRKLLAARSRESKCRQRVANIEKNLENTLHKFLMTDSLATDANHLPLQRALLAEGYRDALREEICRLRGAVADTNKELGNVVRVRKELSARTLSASAKLSSARQRERQWCGRRDAIRTSQQEEFAIEAWLLRNR